MMEFHNIDCLTGQNSTATKTQVTNVALQTDLCDTLYVSKNTLAAYTIALYKTHKHYNMIKCT